eukprot:m.15013 g.15013  ORF g.15013 m.15013 type:complete len:188 (-) comp8541_c0_seq2:265-828(-)
MSARAVELGAAIDWDVTLGNTLTSHRVLYWAGLVGGGGSSAGTAGASPSPVETAKGGCGPPGISTSTPTTPASAQLTVQERLARVLAEGHFTKGRSAADPEVLVSACVAVGLDEEDARRVVETPDRFRDEVLSTIDSLHRRGICSIPVFIFTLASTGEVLAEVHGARTEEDYSKVLRAIPRGRSIPV